MNTVSLRTALAATFVAFAAFAATAQAIELKTYYSKANGKKGEALKTAMYGIITNHTTISYDGLHDAYKTSDLRADGKLRDWYSNVTNYTPVTDKAGAYKKEGDCYNREHCVPQSWFSKGSPMRSDLVHVVPTDGYVNNRRGDYPFGETPGDIYKSANAYSKLGRSTVSGYSGTVFEPNDEVKGDIARIYFYMVTCYENRIASWNGGTVSQVFDGKTYPGLKSWTLDMMLRWSRQDPVDDVERARNEAVYKLQKNRNPFVDYPSLCEYVWGDSISYAFDVSTGHAQGGNNPQPVDPQPVDTATVNPGAISGTIVPSAYTWTATTHPVYGAGFTTTANGLTLAYYKASGTTAPVNVSQYGDLRIYKSSVFLISGAEVTRVVFHAGGRYADMSVGEQTLSFQNGLLTWEGSANPFLATATGGQSRITAIDITVQAPADTIPVEPTPPPVDTTVVEPLPSTPGKDVFRAAQGLSRAELKTALHDLSQPVTVLEYGGGEGHTWAGFALADTVQVNYVRDRYSNQLRRFSGVSAVGGMNIEHIWANSWWGHTVNNAYCDLFNLFPADAEANGRKNNNPIGVVDGAVSYDNGVTRVGKSSGYSPDSLITVWEPADQWKGDFARTYFYMATTYQHMTDEWTTSEGLLTVDPAAWQTMRPWVSQLMLRWAEADPVDSIEIRRNEAVSRLQGNRNPYVDWPQLAAYVWGDQVGEVFYVDPSSTQPELFVPVEDEVVDFGLQALSRGVNRTLAVRGRNLPDGLSATIEGDGFAMEDARLSAEEVAAGTRLAVSASGTTAGSYAATLVLTGAEGFERRTQLRVTLIDGIPAYPATDIVCSVYSKHFTASWMDMQQEGAEGYVLDVYTKDTAGIPTSLAGYPLELTDTFAVISGVKASTTYYYAVHSADGTLVSNEVEVQMPDVTPIFNVGGVRELFFTSTPGAPSQPQLVSVTATATRSKDIAVSTPTPFEVSADGELWTHDLVLSGSSELAVRLGAVADEGQYEGELTLSTEGVRDLIIPLSGSVDASKAFFESFELGSKGGYALADVACNASLWEFNNALLTAADNNRNDSKCVRMKLGGSLTMLEDKAAGCDSLWFYAGLYNNDSGVQLTVSYSLDSGSSWTPVVEGLTFSSGEWRRYGYAIRQDGLIRLRFQTQDGTLTKRLNIDDIQMSDYVHVVGTPAIEWISSETAPTLVYTLDGRFIGTSLPAARGIYVVRRGQSVSKQYVR